MKKLKKNRKICSMCYTVVNYKNEVKIMKHKKTNAARILDKLSIKYEMKEYEVDESDLSAVHVAESTGMPMEMVYKTLVVKGDKTGVIMAVIQLSVKYFSVKGCKKQKRPISYNVRLPRRVQKGRSLMNAIITELIKIIKDSRDNISREENLKKYLEELNCHLVGKALEEIDKELAAEYGKDGWRVERRDERIVQTSYGFVRAKRRLMKKDGQKPIYPLDKELGVRTYQRYSAYFEFIVAKLGAKSVYRVTAEAINTLTPITISHSQVGRIIKKVGNRYAEWEKVKEINDDAHNSPKRVNVLYIEGDALMIKGQNKNKMELHRFQVAEGVVQIGRRRILEGVHYVAEFNYDDAKEEISNYIANHYDLNNTVVITNSDGGLGYGKNVFDEIIGMAKRHEHFRDRYHVNRKNKERIGWAGKRLECELKRAISSTAIAFTLPVANSCR